MIKAKEKNLQRCSFGPETKYCTKLQISGMKFRKAGKRVTT